MRAAELPPVRPAARSSATSARSRATSASNVAVVVLEPACRPDPPVDVPAEPGVGVRDLFVALRGEVVVRSTNSACEADTPYAAVVALPEAPLLAPEPPVDPRLPCS